MKLIDADELMIKIRDKASPIDIISKGYMGVNVLSVGEIGRIVGKMPAVDVKCHWETAIGYDQKKNVQCSNCHLMNYEPTNYCPHCGAKMDGGSEC